MTPRDAPHELAYAAPSRRLRAPRYEKWSPNPLQAKLIVSIGDDLVVPVRHYLIERITPTGLYFIGQSGVGGLAGKVRK
jgi:hypothetical protein